MYSKPFYRRSKFWVTVFAAVGLVLSDGLGLGLEAETIAAVVAAVLGYLGAQGYVDGKGNE